MNLGPQMADNQWTTKGLVLTLDHMGGYPPLKINILKIYFVHAREDQKIVQEPKCYAPSSSNVKD